MFLFDTNYPCSFSKIAFSAIIDDLNSEQQPGLSYGKRDVAFVDGDSTDLHSTIKKIYDLRKRNKNIYVIMLLSKRNKCSAVIKHLSDFVVDKKIAFADLKNLVAVMGIGEIKSLEDDLFGDILEEILRVSQKEYLVIQLLLEGYSQSQISKMLHLSVKTVSGYKSKAVKRYGARNFNQLYMLKYGSSYRV